MEQLELIPEIRTINLFPEWTGRRTKINARDKNRDRIIVTAPVPSKSRDIKRFFGCSLAKIIERGVKVWLYDQRFE